MSDGEMTRVGYRVPEAIMQRVENHRKRLEIKSRAILPGRPVTMTDAVVALLEDALCAAEAELEQDNSSDPSGISEVMDRR